jgi:hypothetical protein
MTNDILPPPGCESMAAKWYHSDWTDSYKTAPAPAIFAVPPDEHCIPISSNALRQAAHWSLRVGRAPASDALE